MVVFLNGKFLPQKKAFVSVFDAGFLYGEGIFETLRAEGSSIFNLSSHLDRLWRSLREGGFKISMTKKRLAIAIQKTVAKNGFRHSRIRVTVSTGVADKPTIVVIVVPLERNKRDKEKGVSVATFPLERPFPSIKSTSLFAQRHVLKKSGRNIFDVLLVNRRGEITEGTFTNVFFVKRRTIFFPPRRSTLSGTFQKLILKTARALRLPCREKHCPKTLLRHIDECFLTNSPRGIIPVTRIDRKKIGSGKPGPVTKKLLEYLP